MRAAKRYVEIPQERAIAIATWRNHPRCLPPKACKTRTALAAKAYSAAGHATYPLNAMAILEVHQAKALKELHEGRSET